MSWKSGSGLMELIIKQSRNSMNEQHYADLISSFAEYDCDNLFECIGMCENFDAAYKTLRPEEWAEQYEKSS